MGSSLISHKLFEFFHQQKLRNILKMIILFKRLHHLKIVHTGTIYHKLNSKCLLSFKNVEYITMQWGK